jgi:two-component system, chemotaxis family, protein-glutamate methylesterase/glutaminase
MKRLVRVLIVDDSAYVRKVVREMLSRSPFLEVVGIARDGKEALQLIEQLKPDVVTCDLLMPVMDGVQFVREQMRRAPLPVLVMSMAGENEEVALNALDAGAVDFIQKPSALATERLFEISDQLIEKVKAAANIPAGRLVEYTSSPAESANGVNGRHSVDIIVIGISTGGPQALRYLIPQFEKTFSVPMAIVMHMPVGYTELYALRLKELSNLDVREAKDGDLLCPGVVLFASAGHHMRFQRGEDRSVAVRLDLEPSDTLHRPSVDVTFRSAAEVYADRVLGVVMTGMGTDGKEGAGWIKSQGGTVYTESESSCVIYGMPAAVVDAGLSDRNLPLNRLAAAILEMV